MKIIIFMSKTIIDTSIHYQYIVEILMSERPENNPVPVHIAHETVSLSSLDLTKNLEGSKIAASRKRNQANRERQGTESEHISTFLQAKPGLASTVESAVQAQALQAMSRREARRTEPRGGRRGIVSDLTSRFGVGLAEDCRSLCGAGRSSCKQPCTL